MKKLRVGVLGVGVGANHVGGYLARPDVELVALCDQDGQRLTDFCAKRALGVERYASFPEMLERARLDAVSICTPDYMHRDHLLLALDAGCDVLCEKPLATSMEDALAMVEASERSGKTVMVCHQFRWVPGFVEAKRRAASGELGTVFYMESDFLSDKHNQFSRSPWYKGKEHVRYPLLGTGCHNVDVMRMVAGDVVEVEAFANHLAWDEFPTDDCIVALFRFASGVIGKVTIAYGCAIPNSWPYMGLTVFGTKGTAQNDRVYVGPDRQGDWERRPADQSSQAAHHRAVSHFVDCVLTGQKPTTDIREGARNVAACLAGVESSRIGRAVRPVGV